jgi:hypothetical protein
MSMKRREFVGLGGVLGGSALAASARGQDAGDPPPQDAAPGKASGRVARFGEGNSTYFALSAMPEGVASFFLDVRSQERIGRLVLTAAERGWTLDVAYRKFPDSTSALAFDVRVEFGAG